MLRSALVGLCRRAGSFAGPLNAAASTAATVPTIACRLAAQQPQQRFLHFAAVSARIAASQPGATASLASPLLAANPAIVALSAATAGGVRTVTKFSLRKGKRKTVKAVLKRFMRLDWGGWIRTRTGRHKKMWRKTGNLKRRLRQHVLVNGTQSWLLDKMVTPFWRRPRHYVNDPYRPYHQREEFRETRRRPVEY